MTDGIAMDELDRLNRHIAEHNGRVKMSGGIEEMAREIEESLANNPMRKSVLDTQVAGNHYHKLGGYQPWLVLQSWLTPEEFRGYMKGTVIAYLAREKDKGGFVDIEKASHTLQALVEMGK